MMNTFAVLGGYYRPPISETVPDGAARAAAAAAAAERRAAVRRCVRRARGSDESTIGRGEQ